MHSRARVKVDRDKTGNRLELEEGEMPRSKQRDRKEDPASIPHS